MSHVLITSASAWGSKYSTALLNVLKAWGAYRSNHTVQYRGDVIRLAQEFMAKEGRSLIVTMALQIQDLRLEDTDIEDMLVEEAGGDITV